MIKKTELVKKAVFNNDWKEALGIAKSFRLGITADQHASIVRAYECIVHPEFYRQIGMDLQKEINKGKEILIVMYGAN